MKTFDINHIQLEVEKAMQEPKTWQDPSPEDYAQTRYQTKLALPDYLPQTENSSAANVALQYEAAAKEVEAMGAELKDAAKRAEAMVAKISEALKYVEETAATYRSEAKLIFERIEQVSLMADAVKEACTELKQKIAGQ